MKKYKSSKYNYIIENTDHVIIYNSLSGYIVRYSDKKKLSGLINYNETVDEDYYNFSMDKGILVPCDTDEEAIARLNHFDIVSNPILFLTILPTFLCNFRCKYCYEDFENSSMDDNIANRICNYVLKNLNQYSSVNVDWFGGEPLLKKDMINKLSEKLIDICHKKNKRYLASMTTNGYLLDYDTFTMMLKNRIYTFQITIDGFDYIHDKYRVLSNGGKSFAVIMKNLLDIKNKSKSSYFKIVIRTNVTNELIPILDNYIKYLYDNFGHDRRFTFLLRPVGDWGGETVKSIKSEMIDSMDNVYEVMLNSRYKLNYEIYHKLLLDSMCSASHRYSFIINPKGIVHKCTMLFNKEENNVGYLDEDGNMILDKQKLSKWIYYFSSIPKECDSCLNRPRCNNSSCPATRNESDRFICGFENKHIYQTLKLLTSGDEKYNFILDK